MHQLNVSVWVLCVLVQAVCYIADDICLPCSQMATTALVDPNALAELLPIKELIVHKLTVPI